MSLPNDVVWTPGDIITATKMQGMTDNDEHLADGTAIDSAGIISRHLKPIIDLVYGASGTIVNANADYDVATVNVTLPAYATGYNIWAIFVGFSQLNGPALNTVKFWNNGTAEAATKLLSKANTGGENMAICGSWKVTATAGAKVYKVTCRSTYANGTNCQGSLFLIATSQ